MRRKLVTLAVLLAVLGAGSLALVLLGGGGDAAGDARAIEVEQFTTPEGLMEILVTVSDEVNVPETAAGAPTASFECLDSENEVVLRSQQTWPLSSVSPSSTRRRRSCVCLFAVKSFQPVGPMPRGQT